MFPASNARSRSFPVVYGLYCRNNDKSATGHIAAVGTEEYLPRTCVDSQWETGLFFYCAVFFFRRHSSSVLRKVSFRSTKETKQAQRVFCGNLLLETAVEPYCVRYCFFADLGSVRMTLAVAVGRHSFSVHVTRWRSSAAHGTCQ